MAKRYFITEEQFKKVISHINENKQEEELLEEGVKDWVMAGLMTLATIAGVKGQTVDNITPDHIKAAEMVQTRLDQGDKDIVKYFKDADIEWNRANLEKLKSVDEGDFEEFSTKSASTTKAKIKQGYTLTDIKITKDTVWKTPAVVGVDVYDTLDFGLSSDQMFKTGSFELTSESMNNLNDILSEINNLQNARIISVTIESSTDKEPIKMGNDVLAEKRANSIKSVLNTLGVESEITINTLPEQGPDVYHTDMSDQEREEARQQTSEFRYVTVTFVVVMEMDVPVPSDENVVDYVKEKVNFELVRIKTEYKTKGGDYKFKSKSPKVKKLKCKKVKVKGKSLPCFFT